MMEYRVRTKRSDEWVERYKGAQVTPEMINLLLAGGDATTIFKPNGKLLAVYLPGAALPLSDELYPTFSGIRLVSRNRGYASGGERTKHRSERSSTPPIMSGMLGSVDKMGPAQYCRLTAFTAQQVEQWDRILPYFDLIAELFKEHVPDRYAAQMAFCERTDPAWVIGGTPFSTITVNNTYPTGLHTDKGDLDEGFSTLGVMRSGRFTGGYLTFPQFGIAANMQHGDVLLMDAHEWHGNTPLLCGVCGESLRKPDHRCEGYPADEPAPERVSVVSYFRTDMVECGSYEEEEAARIAVQEGRAARNLGINPEEGA